MDVQDIYSSPTVCRAGHGGRDRRGGGGGRDCQGDLRPAQADPGAGPDHAPAAGAQPAAACKLDGGGEETE